MFNPRFFRIRLFLKLFVSDFEGGLEIGVIPKGTKHAIHLWFARVNVFFDRRFSKKRPPIEMIEMIWPVWGLLFFIF